MKSRYLPSILSLACALQIGLPCAVLAGHATDSLTLEFIELQFHYKEELPAPFKSTEHKWLSGGALTYRHIGINQPYLQLRGELAGGPAHFDGTTQTGIPVMDTTEELLGRAEGLFGYTWQPSSERRFALTPYAGLGYRYWRRALGDGNVETYTWGYGSVGLRMDWWRGRWGLVPEIAGRFPFGGNLNVDLPGFDPLDLKLGSRPGFIGQLAAVYRLAPRWVARLTGSFEESRIGQSPVGVLTSGGVPIFAVYEPSSRTEIIMAGIGITYLF